MKDNSEALLPCPFCGSSNVDPKGWASTDTSGPACDDCGASAGSTLKTNAENIAAWNTRPPAASDGDAVEYVARAIRRDRFVRTGRGAVVDESLPLTESELADARAALSALPPAPATDVAGLREALAAAINGWWLTTDSRCETWIMRNGKRHSGPFEDADEAYEEMERLRLDAAVERLNQPFPPPTGSERDAFNAGFLAGQFGYVGTDGRRVENDPEGAWQKYCAGRSEQ